MSICWLVTVAERAATYMFDVSRNGAASFILKFDWMHYAVSACDILPGMDLLCSARHDFICLCKK